VDNPEKSISSPVGSQHIARRPFSILLLYDCSDIIQRDRASIIGNTNQ
jgi:hypothetical protein